MNFQWISFFFSASVCYLLLMLMFFRIFRKTKNISQHADVRFLWRQVVCACSADDSSLNALGSPSSLLYPFNSIFVSEGKRNGFFLGLKINNKRNRVCRSFCGLLYSHIFIINIESFNELFSALHWENFNLWTFFHSKTLIMNFRLRY